MPGKKLRSGGDYLSVRPDEHSADVLHRFNPIIILLTTWLAQAAPGGLKQAVESAKKKLPSILDKVPIRTEGDFLKFANSLLTWVPHENFAAKNVYEVLGIFYFILDQPPLLDLQTAVRPEQIGQDLTWLSSWLVVYAQLVGLHMDTPASLTPASLKTFAVLPIGMAQVSAVRLSVRAGDVLCKGDEISTFAFGGSDIVCVFQRRAGLSVEDLVPSPQGTYSRYGTMLARARPVGGRRNGVGTAEGVAGGDGLDK